MKIIAETEQRGIVEIPAILRTGIVVVEPRLAVVVPIDVEHARVAVPVGCVHYAIRTTALQFANRRIKSQIYTRIQHIQ